MTATSPIEPVYEVERQDLFSGSLLTFQDPSGGSAGFKLFVAAAGLYDEHIRDDEGRIVPCHNFGKPRFPQYGMISEPGGFGAAYHAMTASMQQTGLCIKEQVVTDTSLKEVHTVRALRSAQVSESEQGGLQNLCLYLARGQTQGGTGLIRQRYGMIHMHADKHYFEPLEYFVLPCLEAELRQILHPPRQSASQLGVEEALAISAQLIRGCAYMHAAGYCHRDIKPDNIMVRSGWRIPPASAADQAGFPSDGVQLIDFGLGKPWRVDKLHASTAVLFAAQNARSRGEDVRYLYPAIQNDSTALLITHSAPELYFPVAEIVASSHGAAAAHTSEAFPESIVRGDTYDGWGVGLAIDCVLRGNFNVSQRIMRRASVHAETARKQRQQGQQWSPPYSLANARVAPDTEKLLGELCVMLEIVLAGDIRRWYWAAEGEAALSSNTLVAPVAPPESVAPMNTSLKPCVPSDLWSYISSVTVRELPISATLSPREAVAAQQLSAVVTRMLCILPQQRLAPLQALHLPLVDRSIKQLLPPGPKPSDVLNVLRRNSSVPMQSPQMGATPQSLVTPPALPASVMGTAVNTPQAYAQPSSTAVGGSGSATPGSSKLGTPRLPSEQSRRNSGGGGASRGPPGLSLRVLGAASRSTFEGVVEEAEHNEEQENDEDLTNGMSALANQAAGDTPSPVSAAIDSAAAVQAAASAPASAAPPDSILGMLASSGRGASQSTQSQDSHDSRGRTFSSSGGGDFDFSAQALAGTGLGTMGGGYATYSYPPSGVMRQRTVDTSRDPGESALRQIMRQHSRLSGRSPKAGLGAYGGGDRPPTKRYSAAVHATAEGGGVFSGAAASTRGSTSGASAGRDSFSGASSTTAVADSSRSSDFGSVAGGGAGLHSKGVPVIPAASVDQFIEHEARGIDQLQGIITQEIQAARLRREQDPVPQAGNDPLQGLLEDLQVLEKQCDELKQHMLQSFDHQRRLADNSGLTHSAGCLPTSVVDQLKLMIGEKRQEIHAHAKAKVQAIKAALSA